jgi:hypothetical protein
MSMAGVATSWVTLHHLMVTRDPEVSLHQAELDVLRDGYLRFPGEVEGLIRAGLPRLVELLPRMVEAVGNLTGNRWVSFAGLLASIARDALSTAGDVGTSSPPAIPAQVARTLEEIATELRTFNNPSLRGQIEAINALITSQAAVKYIAKMAHQTERMADALDEMADHARSENIRGDKFPESVYYLVKTMIERHKDDYFVVFNPGTEWQPKFDEANRTRPLGPHYLGYSHDLDILVDFLVGSARPRLGPDAVLHILIPVVSRLAITESLTFPEEMGPFKVSGELAENGLPRAYLCMPLQRDCTNFQHIGSLRPRPRWVLLQTAGLCVPILHKWLSTNFEPIFFECPSFTTPVYVESPLYNSAYVECPPVPPRTLGTRRL